jgi:hypothetical protein
VESSREKKSRQRARTGRQRTIKIKATDLVVAKLNRKDDIVALEWLSTCLVDNLPPSTSPHSFAISSGTDCNRKVFFASAFLFFLPKTDAVALIPRMFELIPDI